MNYITESQADIIMKSLIDIYEFRVYTEASPSQNDKKKYKVTSDGYRKIDCEWDGHGYHITQSDELEENYKIRIGFPGYVNVRLVFRSGKETDLEVDHKQLINQTIIDVDLSDPLDSIVLSLTRDLAPPITINIGYT